MTAIGIAAAGSGGHVFPAIAVADALVELGIPQDQIVFFGGTRMETTAVPQAGYRLVSVNIHGLRRSLSLDNIRLPAKVRSASKAIQDEIRRSRIRAMIVFGGYVSGPAALAASKTQIPLVVHEANAVPGMANKMIAGRADRVLLAYEQATGRLRGGEVVGNPLREPLTRFDRATRRSVARARYGIADDAAVLAVVGGSLGAQFLNDVARQVARRPDRTFSILHICGPSHEDTVRAFAAELNDWHVVGFEPDIADVYAAADLVLSRAGALTVAELEETATPAIVVPLPAGKGYQGANADELVAAGGAVRISQDDPDMIVATIFELMQNDAARLDMAQRAGQTGRRGAAETVALRTLELVNG